MRSVDPSTGSAACDGVVEPVFLRQLPKLAIISCRAAALEAPGSLPPRLVVVKGLLCLIESADSLFLGKLGQAMSGHGFDLGQL